MGFFLTISCMHLAIVIDPFVDSCLKSKHRDTCIVDVIIPINLICVLLGTFTTVMWSPSVINFFKQFMKVRPNIS